jgi:4-hydroxy-2-oxoglutarate aldolase
VDLSGVYPALTTPFDGNGELRIADLKHNIRKYNQTGIAGYVVIGSTGESVLLSQLERDAVLTAVKETAVSGKRLIAGTGAESTAETIENTRRAAQLGYEVALVKTPYYYKPFYKAQTFLEHYRRVADASPIPVLLYSVPVFTGVALESPDVIALSEHPNIAGIKESSGDVRRVSEIITGKKAGFQVLVGAAATVLPSLMAGADGAILALACALPENCVELFDLFRKGQVAESRELHGRIVNASRLLVSELGIAGLKFAMDARGYLGGVPRRPLLPLQEEQKKRVTEFIQSLEPQVARA